MSNQSKKRLSKAAYFLSFNLLFLSIYLNFMHRDNNQPVSVANQAKSNEIKGTVIIENPQAYLNRAGKGVSEIAQIK